MSRVVSPVVCRLCAVDICRLKMETKEEKNGKSDERKRKRTLEAEREREKGEKPEGDLPTPAE